MTGIAAAAAGVGEEVEEGGDEAGVIAITIVDMVEDTTTTGGMAEVTEVGLVEAMGVATAEVLVVVVMAIVLVPVPAVTTHLAQILVRLPPVIL